MITRSLVAAGALLAASVSAINPDLVGTWSSKSAKVLTGPGFYNPINDSFIEPSHTGISYSFTADGFFETAYYRAVANPTNPQCPQAILQFQHGAFTESPDGSLHLEPFTVDGRQLLSDPCKYDTSIYTRYNQTVKMKQYRVSIDAYKKIQRLDLFYQDGTPVQPLYLAYRPPQMLPTQTMNPTAAAPQETGSKRKRSVGQVLDAPLNRNAKHIKRDGEAVTAASALVGGWGIQLLWWSGVGMCLIGGAAYVM